MICALCFDPSDAACDEPTCPRRCPSPFGQSLHNVPHEPADRSGHALPPTVAALYVESGGCYFGLPGVDPWDEARDARTYDGPWPVVAHPPCQRWGRFWHGSTRKPHQYRLGADGGCFEAALAAVRQYGGVIEHPADSKAWAHFDLNRPTRGDGWIAADLHGGFTCYVEQGHYGHASRKPTWLLAYGTDLPELNWARGEQRIPEWMLERYGYEKARRIGVVAMVGGKDKTTIRNATPVAFRDLLLSIARTVSNNTPREASSPARAVTAALVSPPIRAAICDLVNHAEAPAPKGGRELDA